MANPNETVVIDTEGTTKERELVHVFVLRDCGLKALDERHRAAEQGLRFNSDFYARYRPDGQVEIHKTRNTNDPGSDKPIDRHTAALMMQVNIDQRGYRVVHDVSKLSVDEWAERMNSYLEQLRETGKKPEMLFSFDSVRGGSKPFTRPTYWYAWIETDVRYTGCLVRHDVERGLHPNTDTIDHVKELALQQLPHDEGDEVQVSRLPEMTDQETWHLCNFFDGPKPKYDPMVVLKGVQESLELCESELPPHVWNVVKGYFHTTARQVKELTSEGA